ncbi:deoxyribodipyrimidine photo-lyase type I [Glycomyces sambucus]|uniref:Deoxyribodipyrimidine photo-lyase type I n=1 Tax=Glycomyces sambucus TaxID=380244 RepID=A0A1G9N7M6_9ACTN|nr:deoxyribodipyrimidine photo-lyase [Glycomyces sambucus]SDL82478.1 deoxyribodipyrimidine photo-lyase type I [Glycomyces sambucus]
MTRTAVLLFTRDLRVHDNPALAAACEAGRVVPLYVDDPARATNGNQRAFLLDALDDLRESLRGLGGDLVVRSGDTAEQVADVWKATGADLVVCASDAGKFAAGLLERLGADAELQVTPGPAVVEPGRLLPSGGGDHYKVFTPYWRAWSQVRWRATAPEPDRLDVPDLPDSHDLAPAEPTAEELPRGGERAGLARLDEWAPDSADYAEHHDDLAGDRTSRLSPYLALGCLSARELAADPRLPEAMVRQLCWRDFHLQVLNAFPDLPDQPYKPGARTDWEADLTALEAWRTATTGIDIVDAGMRQLHAEGWMHNRARLITAGYLVKTLGLDWRDGEAHFAAHLVDYDEANNAGNWQWTAGTGNDTRPNRGFNHERQAGRFDPDGAYRRRWSRG